MGTEVSLALSSRKASAVTISLEGDIFPGEVVRSLAQMQGSSWAGHKKYALPKCWLAEASCNDDYLSGVTFDATTA